MCAPYFRPCNFYHKFRRQFFAPSHARFSRLVLDTFFLSLSLSVSLFSAHGRVRKIAGILRSIGSVALSIARIYRLVQRMVFQAYVFL
jgi:hypothetical protein